jgi:hypothetical protein
MEKISLIIIVVLTLCFSSCLKHNEPRTYTENGQKVVDGVYQYYVGEKEGLKIWVVNGSKIRQDVFDEFVYGGNGERYTFNPPDEIWIDNAISCEEYETTLAHELNERNLMAKYGWTYDQAHDSSLNIELKIREENRRICSKHEANLSLVPPIDCDSVKEIPSLPGLIKLSNIYRFYEGERQGISIWIVDGYMVRKNIYPDFGFSGNDKAYYFIPNGEIWIDGQVSCDEFEYSVASELKERELMSKGVLYDDAYEEALKIVKKMREDNTKIINKQKPVNVSVPLYRDIGTANERNK